MKFWKHTFSLFLWEKLFPPPPKKKSCFYFFLVVKFDMLTIGSCLPVEIMIHRHNPDINRKPLFWKLFPQRFLHKSFLIKMFEECVLKDYSIQLALAYHSQRTGLLLFYKFKAGRFIAWQQRGLDLQVIRMRDVSSSSSTITSLQHQNRKID